MARVGPVARVGQAGKVARYVLLARVRSLAMAGPDARSNQNPWSRSGQFYVIRWKFENTQPTIKKAPRVSCRYDNLVVTYLRPLEFKLTDVMGNL
jgi:hypothetical protein